MAKTKQEDNKPYRIQERFWLDITRQEEYDLAEYVQEMKRKRSFANTIREALHLIRDLRAGKLECLIFLFPWVHQAIYVQAEADILARQSHPQAEPPQDRVFEQLARLETLMLQQGNVPIPAGELPSKTRLPARLPATTNGDQKAGDTGIEIKKAAPDAENNPAFNFAITTAPLNGGYETLPPEVLEYGLRTGKIASSAIKPKSKLLNAGNGSGNAKKMEVPALAAPVFDDDDDPIDLFK